MHTFYEILQHAKETASGHESNRYGVEVGVVSNVQDPQQLGRVKVQIPRLPDGPESHWARVAQPALRRGRYRPPTTLGSCLGGAGWRCTPLAILVAAKS